MTTVIGHQEAITREERPKLIAIAQPGGEQHAVGELFELSKHQFDPLMLIRRDELEAYLQAVGGAKGISVPDVREPQQISLSLYIGATTPRAASEVPHWHAIQSEAYVLVHGEAEVHAKHRWDDSWTTKHAVAGTLLIVRPEVCHWFQWRSAEGLALVFKAPQVPGVGLPPSGKVTCHQCPHYQRTCEPPATVAAAA